MDSTTIPFTIQLPTDLPFVFSLQSLTERFQLLTDQRKARGVRYPLHVLLVVAVLAKLSGHSRLAALADWAHLRARKLAPLFGLTRPTMPHQRTWSRVFGGAVDVDDLEPVVCQCFRELQHRADVPTRESIILAVDGKTPRGTIPTGQIRGVHLVAAYLPKHGKLDMHHSLQNYVVLTIPVISEDERVAISQPHKAAVFDDRTHDYLSQRDRRSAR